MFLSSNRSWLRERLESIDWTLIWGSAIISAGMLIARILGLGFSLILARFFSPDDFGHIQYVLAMASILAIVIHPFGQHVIARFISIGATICSVNSSEDRERQSLELPFAVADGKELAIVLNNCWFLFVALLGLTLIVSCGFVWFSDILGFELVVVVLGIALFYAYWGVSRGYMRSELLTAAYLGSNVVQLVVVFLLIWLLRIHSTALSLWIYGLSYVPIIFWIQKKYPLSIHFDLGFTKIRWSIITELFCFALPVTLSHAAFMLFVVTDLLFLNQMVDFETVGRYALAKTLSTAFAFIPMGISTVLMPQIARNRGGNHRTLLLLSVSVSLLINLLFLVGFWILVEWFVYTFFGSDYLATTHLYIVLALSAMMLGVQSIVASAYVGMDLPEVETIGRGMAVLFVVLGCWLLIPHLGELGAAISVLAGSIAALIVYIGHGYLHYVKRDRDFSDMIR